MELTGKEFEVFEGLMLSDGGLKKIPYGQNSRFSMTSKHREFVDSAIEHMLSLRWAETTESDIYDKRTRKTYHRSICSTFTDPWITEQFYRWYVDGVKIVPKDLIVTDTVLLWWYLGDGCLLRKKSRPNYRRLSLSTNSFSILDLEFLRAQLEDMLGCESIYFEKNGKDQVIIVGRDALVNMANLLKEKCPIGCYLYKFEFGNYFDPNYFKKSYKNRPVEYINSFRKENKVRELSFINKNYIEKVEN